MTLPGGWELVLVVLVIMVLFGFRRLPEAARNLGQALHILRTEVDEVQREEVR